MPRQPLFTLPAEISAAQEKSRPVVALESTVFAHGLPYPNNVETAQAMQTAIRQENAHPAIVAVIDGRPIIGIDGEQLLELAQGSKICKASRRDLAATVAQNQTAATTVAATMHLAHCAGIAVFSTGGIGGVHRGDGWDLSADLLELSRTPVAVVCAGAKSILDLPPTLEVLESLSVPVVGYQTDEFPAFYLRSSGQPVSARVDSPEEAAELIAAHWELGGGGLAIVQPIAADAALEHGEFEAALQQAERSAKRQEIRAKELTPFLLAEIGKATGGKSLRANTELLIANARLGARIAGALSRRGRTL